LLQPFAVADATLDSYRRYVRSSFPIRDQKLDAQRELLIDEGLLWAEQFVSLARPGTTGPKLASLDSLLLKRTLSLPWGFGDLYDHQHRAIERLVASQPRGPRNTLVLSGTGSGKTESFLIPLVDACLRDPGPGVKAIVIYPMNALANDQLKRLTGLLGDCPDVTFGRYTGDAPETDAGDQRRRGRPGDVPPNLLWSRQAMRETPPNILLTNYTMLEYMLLRGKDSELFRYGAPQYLVVDEIHLFTGVLGAEVACLLRRIRQHVGASPEEICGVGTGATAGSGEESRLLEFAGRFFGAPFEADAAIAETPAPFRPAGATTPATPSLEAADLIGAHDTAGLAALAHKVFGVEVEADESFGLELGKVIDEFRTVSVVEHAFAKPAPITDGALALAQIDDRKDVGQDVTLREATAILLLGAAALQVPIGEEEPQPRFRPRVHQVLRSLAGLWRCLDPACGRLAKPGDGRCSCGGATLPLASCRTCGEAYWSSPTGGVELAGLDRLQAIERRRGQPGVFLADPERLAPIDSDEEGTAVVWDRLDACPTCAAVAAPGSALPHDSSCPTPTQRVELLASTDDVHCPSCGDQGARTRPILLPLQGSAAASVAVLTQSLSDELRSSEGEAGGRLLVFADSRQNAGQQAGYADDQGARIAVRQLLVSALSDGELSLPSATKAVRQSVIGDRPTLRRWLIGEADRRFAELAQPEYEPSSTDEDSIERQLAWEIVLDVTERSRRRFSLEQEGIVVVGVERLDEQVAAVAKAWPGQPFKSDELLGSTIRAVADVLRYGRAVDHWMLKLSPRALSRNHGVRVGDRGVTTTRGWTSKKFQSGAAQVDLRGWTAPKNATRMTELVARVLKCKLPEANEVVETLASRLHATGFLAESRVEGRKRQMLDHKRLVFALRDEQPLWRCDRCGTVRPALLADIDGGSLCTNWRCPGTPEPFVPAEERNFYRRQYLAAPRRLIVREHSGQIEGEERLALEERFNDHEHPTLDVLACTPTLEVGVSLDDLHAVILRNLPPAPANYAQRVGRAGRRSKVGLAFAHAGQAPHDSYFFDRPGELIAGLVRAPAISLDNEPLLRRHVNSLILETLGIDLPTRWVPPLEDSDDFAGSTVADKNGVLLESTLKPLADRLGDSNVRAQLEGAVRSAFASPHDPSPPADAERIALDQLDRFLDDLRAALRRWTERYRALLDEYTRLRTAPGLPSDIEQKLEKRLLLELQRLAGQKAPEQQPLGFLGLVGFLPRYGFTGESVLLYLPQAEEPIVQAASVAVTEFAPENIVYARGRKLKVRGLDPAPVPESEGGAEHRDNVLRDARRCDACEFLSFDPLRKTCPTCDSDLVTQQVVELTGVRASGGQISSEDEYRSRADYTLAYVLAGEPRTSEQLTIGGLKIERTSGREIIVANRGLRASDGSLPQGFEICTGCGSAHEAQAPAAEDDQPEDDTEVAPRGHSPRCPGIKDSKGEVVKSGIWLTARVRGDALEIELPEAARAASFAPWRATLAEALKLGIRESMQAGQRDLASFERRRNDEPWSIVIYDTMPGGTGYLPKLFADGAEGLKEAAAEALRRLESCDCTGSCHRCLRDFWNQRLHGLLNRFEVMATLRRLAEGKAIESADPENEKLESFLEIEFFERLSKAKLPAPTLQVVRELGKRPIIRVDAVYRDPNISIFLDGRAFHAQVREKIESDLETRNRLEAAGELVLEFTFDDVINHFDEVAETIQQALSGRSGDGQVDPKALEGLNVADVDQTRREIGITIDAEAWLSDAASWRTSLASANRLRLAGWRLSRTLGEVGTG
jgi:hypothetical protein